MKRTDFYYELPKELIAQRPIVPRSASRLLELRGGGGARRDLGFRDFPALLRPDDLLVFNDTRVVPARVHGTKDSGGRIELLLERVLSAHTALVHARASKGMKPHARVLLPGGQTARMLGGTGSCLHLEFSGEFSGDVLEYFEAHGEVPLPPYIDRPPEAPTANAIKPFMRELPGAVAAPTAGLHFDAGILAQRSPRAGSSCGSSRCTWARPRFQPVRADDIGDTRCTPSALVVPRALAMPSRRIRAPAAA